MKFGDKLIALRKKNGYSQEELAEKLNVSRQSVSKWESNNTYPETDKIVQICNIFNCSMDDLINDKIMDIEQVERKEKGTINIDSLLDFITKTIDMFTSMTFGSGLKCVIELFIIACVMAFGGFIVINIATALLDGLLSFIGNTYTITNFIASILGFAWFILTIICVIHIFKIRYLDYYDQVINENDKNNKKNQEKVELKNKNSEKITHNEKVKNIVIRDKKNQPLAFLSILSNLVIWFMKFCALMFNVVAIITLFAFVVCFVIIIPFSLHSLLFLGINLGLIAAIFVTLLIIIVLFKFIFNQSINLKLAIILFVCAIIIGGIGSGLGVIGLKDIEVRDISASENLIDFEEKIYYSDNLFIDHYGYDIEYIIDNNIENEDIIINTKYDNRLFKVNSHYNTQDNMNGYSIHVYNNLNFKNIYNIFIKDLKNNILVDYSSNELGVIKVRANNTTIEKLMNNSSKIYLYNKTKTKTGFITDKYEYKVVVNNDGCSGRYDATEDTMKINSKHCKCERKTIDTYKGTKVIYNCISNYEEYDENEYLEDYE